MKKLITRNVSVDFKTTPYELVKAIFHYGAVESEPDITKPFNLTVRFKLEKSPQIIQITIPMKGCLEVLEHRDPGMVRYIKMVMDDCKDDSDGVAKAFLDLSYEGFSIPNFVEMVLHGLHLELENVQFEEE